MTGLDSGSTTWKKIRSSPAPSIRAASRISCGVARKKLTCTNTRNGAMAIGRITANHESRSCSTCVIRMYMGTSPPVNSIGM